VHLTPLLVYMSSMGMDDNNSYARGGVDVIVLFPYGSVLDSIGDTGRIRPVYGSVSYTAILSQCVFQNPNTGLVRI
jgi:hypothetical protein